MIKRRFLRNKTKTPYKARECKGEISLNPRQSLRLLAFLDLAFLEDNMLAHNRIVLAEFKFLRVIFWVLFCDVKETCVGGAHQFNVVF